MRALPFFLMLLAFAAAAACMPGSSAEYGEMFTEGDFEYEMVEGGVSVFGYEPVTPVSDVVIPATVSHGGTDYDVVGIGSYVFFEPGVVTVTLPDTLVSYSPIAVASDTVESIIVGPGNPCFSSEDGVLYDKNKSVLFDYPRGKQTADFVAPSTVVVIGSDAFYMNKSVTSVTLPDTVYCINQSAFDSCESLVHVNTFTSADTLPEMLVTLGEFAFCDCVNLEHIALNEALYSIGSGSFQNTGLHTVTIPRNVTSIANGAFSSCRNLASFESYSNSFDVIGGVLYEVHNQAVSLLCYPSCAIPPPARGPPSRSLRRWGTSSNPPSPTAPT